MTQRVTINSEGGVQLPENLRKAAGFKTDGELVAVVVAGAIVLRDPAHPLPEDYSDERIAEFAEDEAAVSQWLANPVD